MALAFGDFVFDPERQVLRKHGAVLKVDPQQLALLACMVARPGQLLTREELLVQAWEGRVVTGSALSVAVAKLRRVLGGGGKDTYIESRYGRGYRFVMPVSKAPPVPSSANDPASSEGPHRDAMASLVGREGLWAQLEAALHAAHSSHGSMCALIGEAGIGKTRMAEALAQRAEALHMRCAWARYAAAEGTPPLFPFIHALRALNLEGMADDVLASLTKLSEWQPSAAALSAAGQLSTELQYEGSVHLHRLLDQIYRSLVRLSEAQPLLIVMDDVHSADAASLRLLGYLQNELSSMRALIVVTLRGTELAHADTRQADLIRLLSNRCCQRHELPRLCADDVEQYVEQQFGAGVPQLAQAVFARSGGNPFYMVELLRPWSGSSPPSPEQLRYPGLALDLMRQRLSELPEGSRAALSVAAVIGPDFDLGLLSRVTGKSADHLLEELDSSLANESIVASSQALGAFAFAHELIREALYGELPRSERCRIHLQIGLALEQRRAAGLAVASSELAHHFLSALPHGDVRHAIAHARAAASAAMRVASHADARALLSRALEAVKLGTEPEPATFTATLLELALVERILGDARYTEHLKRGLEVAREHRLGALLATAGSLLSPGPGLLARADALEVLEAALEELPEADARGRSMLLIHLAWTPPNCMSARRVTALLGQAEALLKQTDAPEAHAKMRDARLFFCAGPSNQEAGEATAQAIERDLRARPEVARSARLVSLASTRLIMAIQRGDSRAAQAALDQHAEAVACLNNSELDWHRERMLLVLRMNRGDFRGAAEALGQLRTRAERLGLQAWRAVSARDYGQLLYWTGDASQLAPLLKSSLSLSTTDTPIARSHKLRALVEVGLIDDARQALASVSSDSLRDLPQDRDYLSVLAQISVAIATLGSREHAAAVYELLSPYPEFYAASVTFECMGSISHFLGRLACVLGDVAAAASHLQHAIAYNEGAELAACTAQSQYELAKLLLNESAVRDVARAHELLASARRAAEARGLAPLVRAIDARSAVKD